MRRITTVAAALMLAASAMATLGATSAQAAEPERDFGCPRGAVCIYPGTSFNPGPSDVFFSYGAHNLQNQFGRHYVFNNQVQGARLFLCTGFNGTGNCQDEIKNRETKIRNLTPINSIRLDRFSLGDA
jgi:hypothetical protein